MAAHGLRVVLDTDRGRLGGPQCVDAQQVGQGAVVDGDGLGDLQEADQLQPVKAVSSALVRVHLRQPRVDGRVGRDQAIDVGEPEEPADPVHHRVGRRRHRGRPRRGRGCTARRGRAGSREAGPARCPRTSRTNDAAGRRTGRGCARSSGQGTTPPPTGRWSSTSAGTAAATDGTSNTSRDDPGEATPCPPPTRRGTQTNRARTAPCLGRQAAESGTLVAACADVGQRPKCRRPPRCEHSCRA